VPLSLVVFGWQVELLTLVASRQRPSEQARFTAHSALLEQISLQLLTVTPPVPGSVVGVGDGVGVGVGVGQIKAQSLVGSLPTTESSSQVKVSAAQTTPSSFGSKIRNARG